MIVESLEFKPDPKESFPKVNVLLHDLYNNERGSLRLTRNGALMCLASVLAITCVGLFANIMLDSNLSYTEQFTRGVVGSFAAGGAVAAGSFLETGR